MIWLVFFSFLISRIIFINSDAIFFDSPEYISRLSNPNFLKGLTSGHLPLHAGYVSLFHPIYQVAKIVKIDPGLAIVISQILLSCLTVITFYKALKTLKLVKSETHAFYSTLIISLLPMFWISNMTIMIETTYVAFFIFSLYFLSLYFRNLSKKLFLVLSSLFLGYSLFTHLAALLYFPVLIFLVYLKAKSKLVLSIVWLLGGLGIFGIISGLIVSLALDVSLAEGIRIFFFGKLNEQAQLTYTVEGYLRFLRNWIIPLLRNNTNLIVVLSAFSLIGLYRKNRTLFLVGILWILPSFIANQWWDSVLFGRHALLTSFGLALLASYLIQKKKFLLILTFIYLLISVIPAIFLLKQPIPYLELAKSVSKLSQDSLYIESHFARPQIQEIRNSDNTIFVDEPGWQKDKLLSLIKNYLEKRKPVFISSQALSEPYGLYSGPYLHSLSLSYKNEYVLQDIISKFSLKEFEVINKDDNLAIYQIVSLKPSSYPAVQSLKLHPRRLDYTDPISRIWFTINRNL